MRPVGANLLVLSLFLCFTFLTISALILLKLVNLDFGREYDVRVINGFSNNSSLPLVIWCVSSKGGDELGGRALQEGDDFSWSVRTSGRLIWMTPTGTADTRCTIKWDEKRKSFHAFEAAKDISRCSPLGKCSWLVKEDGFYFSSDEVSWTKNFSWS